MGKYCHYFFISAPHLRQSGSLDKSETGPYSSVNLSQTGDSIITKTWSFWFFLPDLPFGCLVFFRARWVHAVSINRKKTDKLIHQRHTSLLPYCLWAGLNLALSMVWASVKVYVFQTVPSASVLGSGTQWEVTRWRATALMSGFTSYHGSRLF